MYPVQFDRDPCDGIDRVLDIVVDKRALGADRDEYSAAVDAALNSTDQLAGLIPQPHPEATVRAYLTALRPRLRAKSSTAE